MVPFVAVENEMLLSTVSADMQIKCSCAATRIWDEIFYQILWQMNRERNGFDSETLIRLKSSASWEHNFLPPPFRKVSGFENSERLKFQENLITLVTQ